MLFKRKPSPKVTDQITTRNIQNKKRVMSYRVANAQDIGRRPTQQDSFSLLGALDVHEAMEKGVFAIIADGMGGMSDGKAISDAVVKKFCEAYRGLDLCAPIGEQLAEHAADINEAMYVQFGGDSGSTAVMVMIYHSMLYWLSVGDSSVYIRRDKRLYRINRHHNLISDMYGDILSDNHLGENRRRAETNEEAECLTQYFGLEEITQMDCSRRPLKLRPGDVIFLCSDGVSGVVGHNELCDILGYDPREACGKILEAIQKAGRPNQDNATAIVLTCC